MTQNILTKGIEKLVKTLYFLQQYGKQQSSQKSSKKTSQKPKKS